jgi:hypothetical protein
MKTQRAPLGNQGKANGQALNYPNSSSALFNRQNPLQRIAD